MPAEFRDLPIDATLAEVASTPFPYDYWDWKKECAFPPDHEFPKELRRPWMFVGGDVLGQPKRPLGEVYFQRPGELIFTRVCSNCHGALADGSSGIAKALSQLSGTKIRVANLMEGMFGPMSEPNRNLLTFTALAKPGEPPDYGAARYLVWLASGGTQVSFPHGFEGLLGDTSRYGGNMLNVVRVECSKLLPPAYREEGGHGTIDTNLEFWERFCAHNNPIPKVGASEAAFEQWKRKAQNNSGVMMFFFFRDQAAKGKWPVPKSACEKVMKAADALRESMP
jgi:hypothetical protein